MKKIINIIAICVMCACISGCGKFSDRDIKDLQEKEDNIIVINDDLGKILFDVNQLICDVFSNKEITIEDIDKNKELLNTYKKKLKEYDVNRIKEYHEYMVENENTTKVKEDDKFLEFEGRYKFAERQLYYCMELLSYFDDNTITRDEYYLRDMVYSLSQHPIQKDQMKDKDEVLVELQNELDEKYNTISEGADEYKHLFQY